MKKMRFFGIAALAALWAALTVCAWFGPAEDFSDSERRKLAQFPKLNVNTVLEGKFMTAFEDYTLDQFPLRDAFRQLKSLFHYYVLNQKDLERAMDVLAKGIALYQRQVMKVQAVTVE